MYRLNFLPFLPFYFNSSFPVAYDNSKVIFKWMHERKEGNEGINDLTLADLKPLKYHVTKISPGSRINYWTSGNKLFYYEFHIMRDILSSSKAFN